MIKLFWNTHNQPQFSENNKDSTNYIWGVYHKKNSDKWIYEILKKVEYSIIENEKDLERDDVLIIVDSSIENKIKQYNGLKLICSKIFLFHLGDESGILDFSTVYKNCSYVWRNKPIIVKGSLKRFRNFQYIDDVVNILAESIFNNKLKKNEVFNLTTGKAIRVSKLIKSILKINKKPRHKVIVKKRGTAGDSFGFDASNKYIKKKFADYKFTSLNDGLNKYFKWINKVPKIKNLNNFHPLKNKNK